VRLVIKPTFNLLVLLGVAAFIAGCRSAATPLPGRSATPLPAPAATPPPTPGVYDDSNKGKGIGTVPVEFQNGTATLAQAKAWSYSVSNGDGPVQSTEANLTPTGRPAVFLFDPSGEGNGGHDYTVFEPTPRGLRYIGQIEGEFRVAPPDSAGNPRLMTYWHLGANDNVITLYTLKDGLFAYTAHRTLHGPHGGEDSQLSAEFFASTTVSAELMARAFPLAQ
jgi:hypothetical protein